MANVLRKFPETMTPKELYLMLKNPDSVKMSDAKGAVLHPDAYVSLKMSIRAAVKL
jgi:hypothetical protein